MSAVPRLPPARPADRDETSGTGVPRRVPVTQYLTLQPYGVVPAVVTVLPAVASVSAAVT